MWTNELMINEELSHLFKALAHPTRVDILDLLKKGPISTGELSEQFYVSRYAIMKHLTILEKVQFQRRICSWPELVSSPCNKMQKSSFDVMSLLTSSCSI
jgi:predicted transcriptional regulator